MIPQIVAKGAILNQWNKKQAVALQQTFYETLPKLPVVDEKDSDFALFLYELVENEGMQTYSVKLQNIVYTKFHLALEQIAKFEAGDINQFTELLQRKLDIKRSGSPDTNISENIVVE